MNLYKKKKTLEKEIEKLNNELQKTKIKIYCQEKKIIKNCSHKIVYIYILKQKNIYTCKKCRKNLEKNETTNKIKIVRSFI